MCFYDLPSCAAPNDANYFFNVLVIAVAIRESLQRDSKNHISSYWNIEEIANPRPVAYHFYTEDDSCFRKGENYIIYTIPHTVVEVSGVLGISFFDLFDDEIEDEESEDLWRL